MTSSRNRQQQARRVNDVIDRALEQPTDAHVLEAMHLREIGSTRRLAERVRRRGTVLARRERKHRAEIVRARDKLILAIYAGATPAGWHTAWCDGSGAEGAGPRAAGIGGLVMDPEGRIVAQVTRRVGGLAPFEAEIAALLSTLRVAREKGVQRLRVYTDCDALAQLWRRQRDDPRLQEVSAVAREFRRLAVRSLPRQHNQPAHRLAKFGAPRERATKDNGET
jgi:ribonuclease HI